MNKYLQRLDAALGGRRAAARLSEVFGDDSSPGKEALAKKEPFSMKKFLAEAGDGAQVDVPDGARTVVGAGAGLIIGYKFDRPFVGAIGGASVGRNLPALFDKDLRAIAGRNMAVTGTAIAGSAIAGGSPVRRAIGFGLGYLLGGFVTYWAGWK